VNRPQMVETTAIGAAYLAGLAVGFWKSTDEISKIRKVDKVFEPKMIIDERDRLYKGWLRAVERSRDWVEH
ncbi:MAG: glycerol kinase, partial [Candidatus Fimenecus sp.]